MSTHHAVEVDHEHAILHVLDDQPVDLLEVGDVDPTLRGEIFACFGVAAKRQRHAGGREVAETHQAGLEHLRAGYVTFEQPPGVQREQRGAGNGGVEECNAAAHQPAARRELWEQQDR